MVTRLLSAEAKETTFLGCWGLNGFLASYGSLSGRLGGNFGSDLCGRLGGYLRGGLGDNFALGGRGGNGLYLSLLSEVEKSGLLDRCGGCNRLGGLLGSTAEDGLKRRWWHL